MKTKGKTKLEDLEVKKIDAVDIGADQKANILIKKRGGAEEPKGNFFKRFFNAFCDSLGVNSEDVRKSMEDEATSFDDVMNEKKIYDVRDQIWNACNSLEQSIVSILLDKECEDKQAAIAQSIDQFKAFSDDASKSWIKLERAVTDKEDTVVADDFEIAKMQEVIEKSCDPETINKEKKEKENEMAFDISNMTEEEKKEALKALQDDANEKKEDTAKRADIDGQVQEAVNKAMNKAMEGVTKNFTSMLENIMEPIKKRAEEAEQKSLEEVAKKYELLGTKSNPYPYICRCDLYVQPSRYEGKCVSVKEAQMLGKAVVITNYATAGSQLKDGVDGKIVPLDNKECAKMLAELLENVEEIQMYKKNCCKSDFSNIIEVQKLYKIMV